MRSKGGENMKNKILKKQNVGDLLKDAAQSWDIYAPQKNTGGDVWIENLPKENLKDALEKMVLSDVDVVISPKDIFFPQLEPMFEISNKEIKESIEYSPKLLWGIKSCDLKGILFVDDFFKRNFEDRYYLSRMQDRFTVVIGCLNPPRPEACFCTSAGTGPFADAGYDLQLIDKVDTYIVEIGSKKGDEFVSKYTKFFSDAPAGVTNDTEKIKQKAATSIKLKVNFDKALELMKNKEFIPKENYERIGERCIYCGACLYVCPTCTCFNVFDYAKNEKAKRYRSWDACIFEGYTREASGHNPRGKKWERTSRRYEHKLKYDYLVTGKSGCIGCGRCFSSCPVNIGMSRFIEEITENKKVM